MLENWYRSFRQFDLGRQEWQGATYLAVAMLPRLLVEQYLLQVVRDLPREDLHERGTAVGGDTPLAAAVVPA